MKIFTYIDDDGDDYKVTYTERYCRCSMDCNDDELVLWDDGEAYTLFIPSLMKSFVIDLLEKGLGKPVIEPNT